MADKKLPTWMIALPDNRGGGFKSYTQLHHFLQGIIQYERGIKRESRYGDKSKELLNLTLLTDRNISEPVRMALVTTLNDLIEEAVVRNAQWAHLPREDREGFAKEWRQEQTKSLKEQFKQAGLL